MSATARAAAGKPSSSATGISLPETFGSPQAGDTRFAFVAVSSTVTITAPSGWTVLFNGIVNSARSVLVMSKAWVAGEGSVTINFSTGAFFGFEVVSVSGLNASLTPQLSTNAATTGSTLTATGLTPAQIDELLLAFFSCSVSSGGTSETLTTPSGLTLLDTQTPTGSSGAATILTTRAVTSTTPTGSYSSTANASGAWTGIMLLVPSSVSTTVTLPDGAAAGARVGRQDGDLVGQTSVDPVAGGTRAYPGATDTLARGVVVTDTGDASARVGGGADGLLAQVIVDVTLTDSTGAAARVGRVLGELPASAPIPVSGTRVGSQGGDLIGARPFDPSGGAARAAGGGGELVGSRISDPATAGARVGYVLDQLARGVVLPDLAGAAAWVFQSDLASATVRDLAGAPARAYPTARELIGFRTGPDLLDAAARVGQDTVDDILLGATSGTLSNLPILRVLADFTATAPARPATDVLGTTVELTRRMAVDKLSTKRGRQYELGNPETGTASLNFRDPFELLNPANPDSPYQSGGNSLVSYRPIAIRAVWAGVSYVLYTGYIERYPQHWIDMGFHGVKPLECVDLLGMAANIPLHQSYFDTVQADQPAVWIPCTDSAGPGAVYLSSPSALVAAGKSLPGNPRQGTSAYYQTALLVGGTGLRMQDDSQAGGQVGWGSSQFLDGSAATAVSASVSTGTTDVTAWPWGTIDIAGGTVSVDCTNSTIEYWYKFDAGKCHFSVFQSVADGNFQQPTVTTNFLVGGLTVFGQLIHCVRLPGNIFTGVQDRNNGYPDGQWHYIAIRFTTYSPGQYGVLWCVDGEVGFGPTFTTPFRLGANSILTTADTEFGDPTSSGSVFGIAYYPRSLTDDEVLEHYYRGIGYAGESTTERSNRLLQTYLPGAASENPAPSSSLLMGPDYDYGVYPVPVPGEDNSASNNQVQPYSLLQGFQSVDLSEQGQTFVLTEGAMFFENREFRPDATPNGIALGSLPPFVTVGERTDLGELPYLDIEYDFDPTYIYTQTQLTKGQAGQALIQDNVAGEATFGVRAYTQTVDLRDDWDVFQLGMFILQRYGTQLLRISTIVFDPASNPALWPFVLGLEISQGIRVNRRTSAGTLISGLFWVESVAHDADPVASTWKVTLQLSPMFGGGVQPGLVDDGTSTLPIARTLGVDTVVIY